MPRIYNPETGATANVGLVDMPALESIGWLVIDPNACDACFGTGTLHGQECWHCEGTGMEA